MSRKKLVILYFLVLAGFIAGYILVIRPWYMRWGATAEDLSRPLPGDVFISPTSVVSTRAVTIRAPAENIWPWLVQLGQGRGGFYSYDWLENLFAARMSNAEQIIPALQQIKPGDHISYQQDGPFGLVVLVEPGRCLVIGGGANGSGWSFYLLPVDRDTTRLIVRYPFDDNGDMAVRLFYYSVFEPVHFVMESGMMLGIKQRAERMPAASLLPALPGATVKVQP
jgi:hypothetical protein